MREDAVAEAHMAIFEITRSKFEAGAAFSSANPFFNKFLWKQVRDP